MPDHDYRPRPQRPDTVPASEISLAAAAIAHLSWAKTKDRAARTAPGRAKFEQKFIDAADGDPIRAAHLRKAYFATLTLKSAQARRRNRGAA